MFPRNFIKHRVETEECIVYLTDILIKTRCYLFNVSLTYVTLIF